MSKRINYRHNNVVHAVKQGDGYVGGYVDFLCDCFIVISRKTQIPLTDAPVTCLACIAEGGKSWEGKGFISRAKAALTKRFFI